MPASPLSEPLPVVSRGYAPGLWGQVHYRVAAPAAPTGKPPLLCLHPSPMSGLVFGDFLPWMAQDRVCIAADTPGYGQSDYPPTQPTIAEYAQSMGLLIDHLGLGQVDLFGYHTGCAIAVELGRQRPGAVRKIVFNSALMFTPEDIIGFKQSFAARGSEPLDVQIAKILQRWGFWRTFWRDVPDEARAWRLFWEAERDPTKSTWGFNAVFEYDFPKGLASLDKPVLVLNPEDDLHEITLRVTSVIGEGQIHELPSWTHGFLNQHPARIADIVRAFLDG
jgi:pimeloyl-ACP methyl ester carboxylesterase